MSWFTRCGVCHTSYPKWLSRDIKGLPNKDCQTLSIFDLHITIPESHINMELTETWNWCTNNNDQFIKNNVTSASKSIRKLSSIFEWWYTIFSRNIFSSSSLFKDIILTSYYFRTFSIVMNYSCVEDVIWYWNQCKASRDLWWTMKSQITSEMAKGYFNK